MSHWSKEEKEIIKKYYPNGGTIEVEKHLEGRTRDEIRKMAKNLCAKKKPQNKKPQGKQSHKKQPHYRNDEYSKKSNPNAWTDREIEILCFLFPTGGSAAVQERLPNRSLAGIARRAESLHIQKAWTAEEVEILKEFYPTEGQEVVKRLPDRTARQCKDMAKFKGYKYNLEKDLSFTAYLAEHGKTRADIKKLSKPLQDAWRDEYQSWQREEQKKLNPKKDRRTPEEIERDECYELLADCGVPFGPDGEPIGIG